MADSKCAAENVRGRAVRSWAWVVALVWIGTATVQAADPADEYTLGVGLYNKQRYELAAESFESFLKAAPQHAYAERGRLYLGLTYFNLEQYPKARDTFQVFLRDHPQSKRRWEAVFWSGYSSYLLNDFKAAETDLAAFVKQVPDDPLQERAQPLLGETLLARGEAEGARQLFSKSLEKYPKGLLAEDAKFGLARAVEQLKQYPEAIRLYSELAANKNGARAAEAQLNLAVRHYDDRRYAEAIRAFESLETGFPASPLIPLAQLNRGFAHYQVGDYKGALAQFDRLQGDARLGAEAQLWKGLTHRALGEWMEAVAVFEKGFERNKETPAGERFLYQWAESQLRLGQVDRARELYVSLVDRYPEGQLAEPALFAAAGCALDVANLEAADQLLARFEKAYPGERYRGRVGVLRGRVALGRNDAAGAVSTLEPLLDQPEGEFVRYAARYYLATALQKLGQPERVLQVTEPFVTALEKDSTLAEFGGVLVLRGASALTLAKGVQGEGAAEKRPALVATTRGATTQYLKLFPQGVLADQALSLRAMAAARAGELAAADADLQQLETRYPKSAEGARTTFDLGEAAFAAGDFARAETMYGRLAALPKTAVLRPRALVELGWSQQKTRKFAAAAKSFEMFLADYPEHELAPEAAVMRGTALLDGGETEPALKAFAYAFDHFGMAEQAYVAGLQLARVQARQKQVEPADAAYAALFERFSKRPDADLLLDEWATVNYDAGRFPRADELFGRLVQEFPESTLADNARLVLAESALVAGDVGAAAAKFQELSEDAKADNSVQERSLYQLVRIALEQKNWDGVKSAAERLLAKYPEGTYPADARFHWAEAEFGAGQYKEAAERLRSLLGGGGMPAESGKDWKARAYVLLAESQFRLKQYGEVAKTAEQFKTAVPKTPLRYQVDEITGRSLKAQARFPEAREAFQRVVDDPDGRLTETAARAQFEIGETFLLEKNYASALKAYLTVEIRYKHPQWQGLALYQVGACHEALAEWGDAARTYEALVQDYAQHEMVPKARERLELVRKKLSG